MPTSSERVPNRPLSGAELKVILRRDFDRLLANDGLLSDYVAYGRVAYTIVLRKHLDNLIRPEGSSIAASAKASNAEVAAAPGMAALETPPLASPSAGAVDHTSTLDRRVASPNAERLREGMPIPVERKQQDGTTITEQVSYPRDADAGDGDMRMDLGESL